MKKLLFIILSLTVYISFSQADTKILQYKSIQDVNLRSSSTVNSNIVKVVKKDERLKVIDSVKNWYKVDDYIGNVGYISKDFLIKEVFVQDSQIKSNDVNPIQTLIISALLLVIVVIVYFMFKQKKKLRRYLPITEVENEVQKILKEKEVVGGYDKNQYASERVWAEGRDGTKIPMSMVYKKGMKKDGKNPTLLYAYGSYGYSIDPTFSSNRLTLLDRGFIFVIAHIRGGEDLGRMWYENGKLLKKKNTFYDFIDCGKHLIENNFCSSENLYAAGGSAGGLLMGAVINMAPTLFNGVIAHVPFVDVVTTMLDESIPLTTGEYDEWGNPNEIKYYNYMLSYSPYDNIQKMNYPNLLVTTGLHDSQVQYWEPAKWVAKLRELKTDDNLLILKTNMKAGHGGSSGRFEYLKEIALDYAFLFKLEGITQ